MTLSLKLAVLSEERFGKIDYLESKDTYAAELIVPESLSPRCTNCKHFYYSSRHLCRPRPGEWFTLTGDSREERRRANYTALIEAVSPYFQLESDVQEHYKIR